MKMKTMTKSATTLLLAMLSLSTAVRADEPPATRPVPINLGRTTPGRPLSLAQALAAASRRNVQLNSLRLEVDRAEVQLSKAWSLLFPTAQGSLQYMRADHPDEVEMGSTFPGAGSLVMRRQDDLSGTISVNLPLVRAQSWYAISLGRKGADLARLNVEEARQQLLLSAAQSYHVALVSKALVQLREEQVRSAAHHLLVATRKHAAGSGLRLDVVRAETDLAQARQELLSARLSLDTARDALGVLTGVGGLPMPQEVAETPAPRLDEDQLLLTSRQRLDLQIGRANLELARRQLRSSWSALLPTLAAGWQASFQITDPSDFGDQDKTRWSAMLNLSVPLLDIVSYHDIKLKKVELRQTELRLRDAEQNVGKAVRQARRDYLGAVSSVRIARRQVELAAEGLGLSRTAYQAGAGSSLEVTDARRTAASAETSLATKQLEARIAHLALLRATGEDFRRFIPERPAGARGPEISAVGP